MLCLDQAEFISAACSGFLGYFLWAGVREAGVLCERQELHY